MYVDGKQQVTQRNQNLFQNGLAIISDLSDVGISFLQPIVCCSGPTLISNITLKFS